MSVLATVALVAGSVVAAYVLLLVATGRRSSAGIPTSRLGRALRLGGATIGLGLRAVPARLHRLVTPRHRREALRRRQQERTAERAVQAMGSMKGVMMKLGQVVSFLDELVPPAYAETLRSLQTQAPAMDADVVAAVIEQELGAHPSLLFASFDDEPIASASIGQVHRARLAGGDEVAVKVQYPGVDDAIRADLGNLGAMVTMIGAVAPTLDGRALATELRDRMLEELDYTIEAANQQQFRALYRDDPDLHVPVVYPELSARRVLTSEYCEGVDIYEFCATASEPARNRAGLAIHRFVFDSLWMHRVFNADPHPGNYLFRDDGRVIVLDFGSVKRFSEDFICKMKRLTRLYLAGDVDRFYEQACALRFILPGQERRVDKQWLWGFVRWFHEPILEDAPFTYSSEYTRKAVGQVFGDNMRKVNMPADYLMLNRITFGVNSILARLGARANWHRLARRHLAE